MNNAWQIAQLKGDNEWMDGQDYDWLRDRMNNLWHHMCAGTVVEGHAEIAAIIAKQAELLDISGECYERG